MHRLRFFVSAVLVLAAPACLQAADHVVTAGGSAGMVFTPSDLTINVGDTVTFVNGGGFHNATSDAGAATAFRCANGCDGDGAGGNGDPSSAAWTATVTFPVAGSVPYHCEIHQGLGMVGTITVTPSDLIFRNGFDG